jgi:branched-chain amino acid transport system permease protein
MNFAFHILIMAGIYMILCLSLNLMVGYGGLFNIGHGAFYGIGAYVGALAALRLNIPFPLDMLLSGVITALFGIAIGFPALRLKGDYLALCTFGFGVVMYTVFNNWLDVTGGPQGIAGVPRPSLLSIPITTLPAYLILVAVLVGISFFILNRIVDSPFGKSLMAIREDQTAALAAGKNIARIKIITFCLGAFFAGIAGNLYVHYISIADPTAFPTDESFLIFIMVVFGGMASMRGSILGAFILVIFPELLRFIGIPSFYAAQIRRMLFGFLLVIVIIKRPQGVLGKYKF